MNKIVKFDSKLFRLVSSTIKYYDEFDFNRTPCSRYTFSQEKVFTKVFESKLDRCKKFYSVGLEEEVPDFLYTSLSEASLAWNLKENEYLISVYESESWKINSLILVLTIILAIIDLSCEFDFNIIIFTILAFIAGILVSISTKSKEYALKYMTLISKEDYNEFKPSIVDKIFKKITRFFIKTYESSLLNQMKRDYSTLVNEEKKNSFNDFNLDDYAIFRLNLVNLKFNLNQITNESFVEKSRECLDLGIRLAKYLEFHKDKICYSKEFFRYIDKLLNISTVLIENQDFSLESKNREITDKSLKLVEDLVNILTYLYKGIINSTKDELISKLKVMEIDTKSYSDYIDLKRR